VQEHKSPNLPSVKFTATVAAFGAGGATVAAAPEGAFEFEASFSGGGIGVKLSKPQQNGYAHVKDVMLSGPAGNAGVMRGDLIISVGGEDQRNGGELALQNTVRRVQSSLRGDEVAVYAFRRP
jgi:C-terminal processing protease CtpA/Prc